MYKSDDENVDLDATQIEDNIVDIRSNVWNVITDEDIQMNEDDRFPAQGVINNRNLTIISDNARDIK